MHLFSYLLFDEWPQAIWTVKSWKQLKQHVSNKKIKLLDGDNLLLISLIWHPGICFIVVLLFDWMESVCL